MRRQRAKRVKDSKSKTSEVVGDDWITVKPKPKTPKLEPVESKRGGKGRNCRAKSVFRPASCAEKLSTMPKIEVSVPDSKPTSGTVYKNSRLFKRIVC